MRTFRATQNDREMPAQTCRCPRFQLLPRAIMTSGVEASKLANRTERDSRGLWGWGAAMCRTRVRTASKLACLPNRTGGRALLKRAARRAHKGRPQTGQALGPQACIPEPRLHDEDKALWEADVPPPHDFPPTSCIRHGGNSVFPRAAPLTLPFALPRLRHQRHV